ncbi:hypothetical protein Godav_021296 [Gossypium davidsonii]|uniref:cellulase n=2 Tax=Gossypium TaxID=3633 RepID=A0A7J8R757_GOSDV|nr:hypothetical protein [Gossypium davidsonii]MBA0644232.1 hypothetical protein [Gossypium klotzschianum]
MRLVSGDLQAAKTFAEFGWDTKDAEFGFGYALQLVMNSTSAEPYVPQADRFMCSVLPESPYKFVTYSLGGLLFKPGGSNMQHAIAISFLLLVYAQYLKKHDGSVNYGTFVTAPSRLEQIAKGQFHPSFILVMDRSPKFVSISSDNCPMKTHFRYGSGGFP